MIAEIDRDEFIRHLSRMNTRLEKIWSSLKDLTEEAYHASDEVVDFADLLNVELHELNPREK